LIHQPLVQDDRRGRNGGVIPARSALPLAMVLLLAVPAARADVITDLIRKKQIERHATQEQSYDPVPVIVPNNFRLDARRSDTIPGSEVMDCQRHAWTDRRTEFSELYLPDNYDPQLRREAEATCLARKRARLLHR
jgi:hypothetical protein